MDGFDSLSGTHSNCYSYMKNLKLSVLPVLTLALLSALCMAEIKDSVVEKVEIEEPIIRGKWTQGALLIGKTDPKHKVFIGERSVLVDSRGQFVFGLGRDAEPGFSLTVAAPDGKKALFEYEVSQREYDVQYVEGVAQKYVAPPKEVSERIANDNRLVKKARAIMRPEDQFSEGFTWPLSGKITGVYGSQRVFNGVPKRPHFGLDIAGPVGEPVYAPAPGVVSLAHNDMYYSGGTLIMDHGQGVSSTFIHLSKITVKEGEAIKRGQKVGEVGATGRVTGPHLDWRINWFDQRLDPFLLLPPMPEKKGS